MAQSGYTPIQLYRTTTAAAQPLAADLNAGELAINTLDEKLYFKNSTGTVKLLASSAATAAGGTVTSVAATVPSIFSIAGSPITTSGTLAMTYSGTALPIANGGTGATTLAGASIATYTGTETLTNKTVEAGTFTNGYTEEVFTGNSSTAITLDLANGTVQIITLTGNCVYTFPTPVAGKSFTLVHLQDATGSRTVTWPATVDWPSATAPTLTATALKADKFVFTAISGTSWIGSVAGQNYTV